MKVKIVYIKGWDNEEFDEKINSLIKKGYNPKYESFRVSFNDFGGPGHYFILMEKRVCDSKLKRGKK